MSRTVELTKPKMTGQIGSVPQVSHRAKIVRVAQEVFRRNGFHAASVADITSAAGVPKGSFYSHFVSKEALAGEVVDRYAAMIDTETLMIPGTARERLQHHFSTLNRDMRQTGIEYGCLLGTFAGDLPAAGDAVRAALATGIDTWVSAVETVVADGQRTGELSDAHPARVWAMLLVETFEGAALMAKVSNDHLAPLAHISALIDQIAN